MDDNESIGKITLNRFNNKWLMYASRVQQPRNLFRTYSWLCGWNCSLSQAIYSLVVKAVFILKNDLNSEKKCLLIDYKIFKSI